MVTKSKKGKPDITFIIATFNEEKRIAYPIKSFLPYGEVLVVDNYSKDKTVEIARSLGAKVVRRKNKGWLDNEDAVNFALRFVKTDWTYWGGADEMIPKTCLELYKKVALENKYKIVIQRKRTLLYESGTNFIINFINMQFFKRDTLDFRNNIMHQKGKFAPHVKPLEILYLPPLDEYCIYHFSIYTTEHLMKVINTYSSIQARFVSTNFIRLKLIVLPIWSFIWHFFLGGLFKIGTRGFIISKQFASYEFLTYAKAHEIRNNINYETIEKSFAKEKMWLLRHNPRSGLIKIIVAFLFVFSVSRIHRWYKFRKKNLEN